MITLFELYRAQFRTTIATQLQYRGALVIWLTGMVLEPTIYLVVWSTVARSSGGSVDGYSAAQFAAYFIMAMIVNHATLTWVMWEFEFRIRQGSLSMLLLRPVHPIHRDIADNLTFKMLTLFVLLPVALLLSLLFEPSFNAKPWAVTAFIPAVALAFLVRFVLEWTIALAAFWMTRVAALNQLYYVTLIFLSGQVAPLDLYPESIQAVASILPFRWFVAFPVELALGRLTVSETMVGFAAQGAWLCLMLVLLRVIWRRGLRQFSAVGA